MESVQVQNKRELNEAQKRVRKLRWIGMNDEADELRMTLFRNAPANIAVDIEVDTD